MYIYIYMYTYITHIIYIYIYIQYSTYQHANHPFPMDLLGLSIFRQAFASFGSSRCLSEYLGKAPEAEGVEGSPWENPWETLGTCCGNVNGFNGNF